MNTQHATLVNKTAKIYYKKKGTSGKVSLSVQEEPVKKKAL
jgi:hypothetical protein